MRTLALSLLAGACAPDPGIRVFAASSLQDVLPAVAADFSSRTGKTVTPVFDGTSRLAGQARAGAAFDVFFSADERWTADLADEGLLASASLQVVATNALVVIVPAADPAPPTTLADLTDPRFSRVAVAGEDVPAGRYTRAALEQAGLSAAMGPRLVSGQSVRTASRWVADGEIPVGFVYRTDAIAEPGVRVALTVPPELHPPIRISGGVHPGSSAESLAFLQWCVDEGRPHFATAGFTPP